MLIGIFLVLFFIELLGYRTLSISICTNTPVQKCPKTRDAWASKNDRYRCTGDETYVCIRVANGTLFEGCMTNFNIDAKSGNCPILLTCTRNKPYIGQPSSFFPCPDRILGCPPKNHTDYTLRDLYKYPRCIESNLSIAIWNLSKKTSTTTLATTRPKEKDIHENKHTIVIAMVFTCILLIVIGVFITYVIWRKRKNSNRMFEIQQTEMRHEDNCKCETEGLVSDSFNSQMNDENTVEIASALDVKVKGLRTLIIDINDSEASGMQVLPLKTDDKVELDSIYVPVSMTDETGKRNNDSSNSEDLSNITADEFFNVEPDRPARFVFMLGEAGFGKTVHCQRITKAWCQVWQHKTGFTKNKYQDGNLARCLKMFDFLFFVRLQDVYYEHVSVIDMIQDVYSRYKLSNESLDDIRSILEGENYSSLVLLDGLDEWNISQDKRKLLLDKCIPNCRGMPKSTILISMRSWKFMEVENIFRPKVDRVIRLHGINESSIEQLSRKMLCNYFRKDSESDEFQNFQESVSSASNELKSLMRIPLLAVFCFFSLFEDVNTGYSLTSFYLAMMEALLKRHFTKLQVEPNLSEGSKSNPTNASISGRYPYVAKFMPKLSCLGKMAFENLTSQETSLTFDNAKVNEILGKDTLDVFLKIGLVIKKQSTGRFYEDKIRISFLHQTIQEFLSALYLFHGRNDTEILESLADKVQTIPNALEFSSVINFLCGLSPSVGCGISHLIKDLADKDEDICTYRINFQYKSYQKVFHLYNLQLRCYREVREAQSIETFLRKGDRLKFTFTDVILLAKDSEKLTIRETASVLRLHANNIRSLNMICIPDSKENGITNEIITTFLSTSLSIESLYIDGYVGGRCRFFCDPLQISNLRTLGLANVALRRENFTEMFTNECSMTRLRSLGLLHLKPPDYLDVGFRYQLPSIHWMSTNKSGFIRKACPLPPGHEFRKTEDIPLVKSLFENLPKYQNLTTFYIAYMDACIDRQMLLDVIPEFNSLDEFCHFGYYGSSIHHQPNKTYDAAVITSILKLRKLRYIILRQISLEKNIMHIEKLSSIEVIWLAMFDMKPSEWKYFMQSISNNTTLRRVGLIDTNIEQKLFEECRIYLDNLCVEKFETDNW